MTIKLGNAALSAVDCLFGVSVDEVIAMCDNVAADGETCRAISFWLGMAIDSTRKGYHGVAQKDMECARQNIAGIIDDDVRSRARTLCNELGMMLVYF